MNRKIFSIPELISKGMFSSETAAFLYICVLLRFNITAVGETNTGKTTLINSLDLVAPAHYRKVYIEESPESLDQGFAHNHQLKYQVDSAYANSSKVQEIYKLLHRNPDLVYLGEILTKDEAHAMFHCLSAGLRGFQTIHARDINSLLNRWQFHFNIDPSCYNDLDIVILLKRHFMKRYIAEIAEISYKNNRVKVSPIFQHDPKTSQWSKNLHLSQLTCFQRTLLSPTELDAISDQLQFFTEIFDTLSKKQKWNARKQVQLFQSLYNEIEFLKKNNEKISLDKLKHTLEEY
jgi:Flp pilus assembly CpaF family ATPase